MLSAINRRVLSISLSSILLVSMLLTGCGAETTQHKPGKIRIGMTLYDQYDTFLSQLAEEFAGQIEPDVELITYNASQSQQTQNSQVRKMIEEGCDVICVNLVDRTDPTAVIDSARKAGVPIVFFNRELVEGDIGRWDKLFYVGADAAQSGIMQGELAARTCLTDRSVDKNLDGIIQYVVLEGEAGHQDSIVRTEYSVNTLMNEGVKVDKLGYAIANWNRAQAQTKTSQFIESFGDSIELILSNNDDMALGAIDAIEESDYPLDPFVVGINGTEDALEAIRTMKLDGSVYNDFKGQSEVIMEMAYALAKNEPFPDSIELTFDIYVFRPYSIITYDNVQEYLRK